MKELIFYHLAVILVEVSCAQICCQVPYSTAHIGHNWQELAPFVKVYSISSKLQPNALFKFRYFL